MFETFAILAVLAGAMLAIHYFDGCPKCRSHRQARRWNDDTGINIQCADCGEVSVVSWEDLH